MPNLTLIIDQPLHNQAIVGPGPAAVVQLRGHTNAPPPGPLFFKWYSNLKGDTNGVLATATQATQPLAVGTHTIMFTAKDVAGDDAVSLKAVTNSGMTGGAPPDAPQPCLVHVYVASMLAPVPANPLPQLNRAASTLTAQAPAQWGKPDLTKNPPGPPYTPNPDYHRTNQLRYRWIFRQGSTAVELLPTVEQLQFNTNGSTPTVTYNGPLPAGLIANTDYTLALRVENKDNPAEGHEVTCPVRVV